MKGAMIHTPATEEDVMASVALYWTHSKPACREFL